MDGKGLWTQGNRLRGGFYNSPPQQGTRRVHYRNWRFLKPWRGHEGSAISTHQIRDWCCKYRTRTSLKCQQQLHLWDYKIQLPCGWQEESQPSSLSCILLNKSAIPAHEGINTLSHASSHPLSISPHQFPFPFLSSPLSASLSVLSYFFSLPLERGMGQSLGITLNLGGLLPLASTCWPGWVASRGRERLASHPEHLSPIGSPLLWEISWVIEVHSSYLLVAESLILKILSFLFSCIQEKSPWEQAEEADSLP